MNADLRAQHDAASQVDALTRPAVLNEDDLHTIERAADLLEIYAKFIESDVMAADIERHPYRPEIELTAAGLREIAAAPQADVGIPASNANTPSLYVSWGQLANLVEPDDHESGKYLQVRKTPAGNFTTPLYAHPAAAPQAEMQAEPRSIELDFKQAHELLQMFADEPGLVTLMMGDGHSGSGLYAFWSEVPEEGTVYLGQADDEAAPQAEAQKGGA